MKLRNLVVLLCNLAVLAGLPARAAENMIGRQSQNEGLRVLPVPGKVTIDGDLRDWDWSGRIWCFVDTSVRSRYSVEFAGMWDAEYLYLAAKWKDPMPMFNMIDPAFNPNEGWKADACQMRVLTDRPLWITTWYYTGKKQPVMHFAYWKDPTNERLGQDTILLTAPENGTQLGQAVELAYRMDDDGRGFAQEMKIPWKLLFRTVPEIRPDLVMRLGLEFMWGDATGKTWPVHRYADNMQPGATSREFFWSARKDWGDARLMAQGHVPERQYVSDGGRVEGTVPVRVTIPKDAARFTVVLDDPNGRRVRTLAADCDPADYAVRSRESGATRTVEVNWDCLNDFGRLVTPGNYQVRGLTHRGLGAQYEMCFYNPGTPPWQTKDGSGAWGADHTGPNNVTAAGDWMIITCPVVEGGSGIWGIDPDGRKRWGEKRGAGKVTADATYVYAYVVSWYTKETICRFRVTDGSTQPFILDGKPRTFDLPLTEILGQPEPGKVTGMAVHGGQLVLALSSGKLVVLDAASAAVLKQFEVADPSEIAFGTDGTLYGLSGGKVHQIHCDSGTLTPIATPKVDKAVALSVDREGNIVLADAGPDSQVKVFSPKGKLVYACGKKGGRPIRGAYDEQAMMRMSSVSVDSRGRVWVVENWSYPRRVSVWERSGKLIRDYLGNTGYAGVGCYLHEQDPTLAYCGPIEFQLDKTNRTWKISRILWVPDPEKGESFTLATGGNALPQRFRSAASGQPREYLYAHDTANEGTGHVIFMERKGRWQPVAALCLVGHLSGRLSHHGEVLEEPSGEMAGLDPYDVCLWNDTNRDGKVQRGECAIIRAQLAPGNKRSQPGLRLGNGWGGRLGEDMSIYTDGLARYQPLGFTDDGAPIYGLDGRFPLSQRLAGADLVPVPGEERLVFFAGGSRDVPGVLAGLDLRSGQVQWDYPNPYHSVHGSHRAPMPKPGLLIGPLKTCGVAHVDDTIGNVFLIRGNLGQDFLFTTDGLFVGAMFQDGRLPGDSLPEREAALLNLPMEGFTEGGEPFNGWFGRQSDGKIRLTTGMAREAGMILQVRGLETIRRFTGGTVALNQPAILKADKENTERAKAAAQTRQYTIIAAPAGKPMEGKSDFWKEVPALNVGREGQPDRAAVKLAYDAENLYVQFDVQDSSPWRNEGRDFARLFKTGDAVDLQFSARAGVKPHREPEAGDVRVLIAPGQNQPLAVLMVPVDKAAPANARKAYTSPVGTKKFDRVEPLATARVSVKVEGARYRIEAVLPWRALGLSPQPGMTIRGDVGFISSDAQGMLNVARTYWANPNTNLVNDEPLEAWIYPDTWGEFTFKKE
ncbi:MAG: hypothetical protein WCO56_26515 [Verrucomicrobiota bacterium]